ncbi:helix-turn-helix domain-containing protein [Actinomadura roseirufa]|uniref:helix-turn-helix domain-containing protein n=1 Tax=Actinomadura roseirufa TaxID=2094049 RepID=UPI0013F16A01|nr:AraC family transcriptional regulator [Actinomadura roseirufa]
MVVQNQDLTRRALMVDKQVSSDTLLYHLPDDWFTIFTLLRGSCRIEGQDSSGKRCITFAPGDICRIAPNNLIRLSPVRPSHQPFEIACMRIPAELLRSEMVARSDIVAQDLSTLHTLRLFDPHIASMASVFLSAQDTGIDDHYATSAARYLAAYLLLPQRVMSTRSGCLSPKQLRAVIVYMHEHLASGVTLDQLAKEAALSRYHFIRRFAASTGKTPLQYLTELRIDTARQHLAVGAEPISQVGRRCGFPSPENFARVFRKHVGCSPTQYRRRATRDGWRPETELSVSSTWLSAARHP